MLISCFKLFLQTEICPEALRSDLNSDGSESQSLIYSNCQELNTEKSNLSTNCVPPTEIPGISINGSEISDRHIQNICPGNDEVLSHNNIEYSNQQKQNISLSNNMDISSDSLQHGRVAKFFLIHL